MIKILDGSNFGGYWCLNCGIRALKVVFLTIDYIPKRKPDINMGFHVYLCEGCFRKMFGLTNWVRHWRVNKIGKIVKRASKPEKFLIIKEGEVTKL